MLFGLQFLLLGMFGFGLQGELLTARLFASVAAVLMLCAAA